MERTNYVNKAKSLMMQAARTTALVIMPLAAAVSAHAGSVALPSGDAQCSTTGSTSGSCSFGDFSLSDPGSGVQGVSFFTSGSAFFFNLISGGSGSTLTLQTYDTGTTSGIIPAGTEIPVTFDALITNSGGSTISSWQINFSLGTEIGDGTYGSFNASGSGTTVSGSGFLDVTSDIPASQIYDTVTLQMSESGGGYVSVSVPGVTSFDFGSVAGSSTPEPASLGLMASGLAMFGMLLRRRRKQ